MKLAATRTWTANEAMEAKAFLQKTQPGLWEEIKSVVARGGDLNGMKIASDSLILLNRMHPECEGIQTVQLFGDLLDVMRKELGIPTPWIKE